jgi:hypothetical protein
MSPDSSTAYLLILTKVVAFRVYSGNIVLGYETCGYGVAGRTASSKSVSEKGSFERTKVLWRRGFLSLNNFPYTRVVCLSHFHFVRLPWLPNYQVLSKKLLIVKSRFCCRIISL